MEVLSWVPSCLMNDYSTSERKYLKLFLASSSPPPLSYSIAPGKYGCKRRTACLDPQHLPLAHCNGVSASISTGE